MKIIAFLFLSLFSLVTQAASVNLPTPPGRGTDAIISTDGGTVRWNARAVDKSYLWVVSGNCVRDTVTSGTSSRRTTTVVGFTCAGPGQFHIRTTLTPGYSCPGDGGILQDTRMTLTQDGVVFYDQELQPSPIQCWVTPAQMAKVTFTYPVITFDNSTQPQPSATSSIYLEGYLMSNYTFTSDSPTIVCDRWLKDMSPVRWIIDLREVGTKCTGRVPANSVSTVTVN
jgi:hypothetical protein